MGKSQVRRREGAKRKSKLSASKSDFLSQGKELVSITPGHCQSLREFEKGGGILGECASGLCISFLEKQRWKWDCLFIILAAGPCVFPFICACKQAPKDPKFTS